MERWWSWDEGMEATVDGVSVVENCAPTQMSMRMCLCVSQLGGAMAPLLKELATWLDANPEYAVAPEWAEIVKHSVSHSDVCVCALSGGGGKMTLLLTLFAAWL